MKTRFYKWIDVELKGRSYSIGHLWNPTDTEKRSKGC